MTKTRPTTRQIEDAMVGPDAKVPKSSAGVNVAQQSRLLHAIVDQLQTFRAALRHIQTNVRSANIPDVVQDRIDQNASLIDRFFQE